MLNNTPKKEDEKVVPLNSREKYLYRLGKILDHIYHAPSVELTFQELRKDILYLLDAQESIVFLISEDQARLVSIPPAKNISIQVDDQSIAGYVATTKAPVLVQNVYSKKELMAIHPNLSFDRDQDITPDVRIVQVMALPMLWGKTLVGVFFVCNKVHGDSFSEEDKISAAKIANNFAMAYHNSAQRRKEFLHKYAPLIHQQQISTEDINTALHIYKTANISVENTLMNKFGVKREIIYKMLSSYYSVPIFQFQPNLSIPHDLLSSFNPKYLRQNLWVPFQNEGGKISIAIDNPRTLYKLDDIKKQINLRSYSLFISLPEDILKTIDYFWGPEVAQSKEDLSKFEKMTKSFEDNQNKEDEDTDVDNHIVVKLVNEVIKDAYTQGASDIYFEPSPQDLKIRFRVDGICYEYNKAPVNLKRSIVSRIKIMAELDIANRMTPQDGKIRFKNFSDLDIELRVAILPIIEGNEAVVIRILAAKEPIPIDNIGMQSDILPTFKKLLQSPYGLLLVVGPTGSGKTTTLHSAISMLNTPRKKIWTAEDPVEITQAGLSQVQINNKSGYTFARAMRAFLRAAPDVIMIGEMRDHETAAIAIEASLTGHLVMSTLHTNSAPETITRLIDIGIDPFNFGDALLGVLAQRLVRTLCEKCKETTVLEAGIFDALKNEYDPSGTQHNVIEQYRGKTIFKPKGCKSCTNGYKGRMGIHELLTNSREITALIHKKAYVEEIRTAAIHGGMRTLKQDGILKVFAGKTDFLQVRSACMR